MRNLRWQEDFKLSASSLDLEDLVTLVVGTHRSLLNASLSYSILTRRDGLRNTGQISRPTFHISL